MVSQVFIRSHNRHFWAAVNEKPFNIVRTVGDGGGVSPWLSILRGFPDAVSRGGKEPEGVPPPPPPGLSVLQTFNFSLARCHAFHVVGESKSKVSLQPVISGMLGVFPLRSLSGPELGMFSSDPPLSFFLCKEKKICKIGHSIPLFSYSQISDLHGYIARKKKKSCHSLPSR